MVPNGAPLDRLVIGISITVFITAALIEGGSIVYNKRHTVRLSFELDTILHQSSTDSGDHDSILIHPCLDRLSKSRFYPVVSLLLALASVYSRSTHNIPRRRKRKVSIAPHLLRVYDVKDYSLGNVQDAIGVA